MSAPAFVTKPEFGVLCNIVAEGKTVFLTGAGISRGLICSDGAAAPGWDEILEAVLKRQKELSLAPEAEADIKSALDNRVLGRHSILAASLLFKNHEQTFLDVVHRRLDLKPLIEQPAGVRDQKLELFRAALALRPKGFVTFNVDQGHEMLLDALGISYDVADPLNDRAGTERILRDVLRGEQKKLFLVKAHGSINRLDAGMWVRGKIAFTHSQYRDLLATNPIYRAFMITLLTNFSVVSVGFGMTDIDFDLFRDDLIAQYGGPIRPHVVLEKEITADQIKEDAGRRVAYLNALELKTLVDIFTLFLTDHAEYVEVLREAGRRPGPAIERHIDDCLSPEVGKRQQGHQHLRQLGEVGKRIVATQLATKLTDMLKANSNPKGHDGDAVAELTYTLGTLEPSDDETKEIIRDALLFVAENCCVKEPIAHALSVLHPYVAGDHLPTLYGLAVGLKARGIFEICEMSDPDDRLPVYLETLILRTRATYPKHPAVQAPHVSVL